LYRSPKWINPFAPRRAKYRDSPPYKGFEGFKARAQLEATIRVPSIDFSFKIDLLETRGSGL
jgi:hypothetical protein